MDILAEQSLEKIICIEMEYIEGTKQTSEHILSLEITLLGNFRIQG